jgi:hypothetical protein
MHRRVGHPNDYWSFTIIWRRISHCHSILGRKSNASDGQIATLTDPGRRNGNRLIADSTGAGSNPSVSGGACSRSSLRQHGIGLPAPFAAIQFRPTWVGLKADGPQHL